MQTVLVVQILVGGDVGDGGEGVLVGLFLKVGKVGNSCIG